MWDMLVAIWQQDFSHLTDSGAIGMLVFCLALILFLESAFVFLPLPGDSLILLSASLVVSGVFSYEVPLLYLPLAAALGSIVAYWQGYALAHTRFMVHMNRVIPPESMERAHRLLEKHGMLAMFISRFIPFVRIITPMLMGMTGLHLTKVAIISFVSAFCWALVLSVFSAGLLQIPEFAKYQQVLTQGLLIVSLILFIAAVVTVFRRWYRHHKAEQLANAQQQDNHQSKK